MGGGRLIQRGWDANRLLKTVLVGGTAFGLGILGAANAHTPTRALIWISISIGGLSAAAPVRAPRKRGNGCRHRQLLQPAVGHRSAHRYRVCGIGDTILCMGLWHLGDLSPHRNLQLSIPVGQDRKHSRDGRRGAPNRPTTPGLVRTPHLRPVVLLQLIVQDRRNPRAEPRHAARESTGTHGYRR